LENPNHGGSHFPHNFLSSYEYLIHCESEDSFHSGCAGLPGLVAFWVSFLQLNIQFVPKKKEKKVKILVLIKWYTGPPIMLTNEPMNLEW
jgi:hypothetical protein